MAVATCPEAVADDELAGPFARVARPQRRHRVEIDQQHRAPAVAQILERAGKRRVVGRVDPGDSRVELRAGQAGFPHFTQPREPPRDEPQPAARAAVGERMPRAAGPGVGHHRPVHVVGRAVKVEHRARRVRDEQRGAGLGGERVGHRVDVAIFQPQLRVGRIAHPVEQFRRIGATAVRRCDHHRKRGAGQPAKGERRRPGARDRAAGLDLDCRAFHHRAEVTVRVPVSKQASRACAKDFLSGIG
jgi:hypothetical protein